MASYIDLTGKQFGYWKVIKRDSIRNYIENYFCRCKCGVERSVRSYSLLNGQSQSCGCFGKLRRLQAITKYPKQCAQFLNHIKSMYGLTGGQFAQLVIDSNGRCFNCGVIFSQAKKSPDLMNIHHDHETKKVMGLWCHACNVMEGYMKAYPQRFLRVWARLFTDIYTQIEQESELYKAASESVQGSIQKLAADRNLS